MGRTRVADMDVTHNMHKTKGLAAVTVRAQVGAAPARSMGDPRKAHLEDSSFIHMLHSH